MHARKLGAKLNSLYSSNSYAYARLRRVIGQSTPAFGSHDPPYTAPEDDPFNIKPLLEPRRRRSSMLNKWIQEQQTQPTDVVDVEEGPSLPGPRSHPYLAYPELAPVNFDDPSSSSASFDSYDLLEDDDIPQETQVRDVVVPTTPITPKTSRIIQTPPSFRGFHIPFRSSSPATSLGASSATAPRTPGSSRGSFFHRSSSGSTNARHKKSSSLSTLSAFMGTSESEPVVGVVTPSKSRWRPSVLGHFGISASQPSILSPETQSTHARSRPSISSNTTYTTTTQTDSDLPITPPRSSAGESVRTRNRSYGTNSTISCDGYIGMPPRAPLGSIRVTSTMSSDGFIGMPARVPLAPKPGSPLANSNLQLESILNQPMKENRPQIAYSPESNKSRTLPRVSFAALGSRKKKKRLVISGIAADDSRKFEAAKRWCESFGELSQILRMPNGDLHVHFRNAEVADTVCRVRAKVYIRGVGSVQLSWYMGTGTENIR
ncbi:hypothetical protein C8F01DRAFT_973949 [Mycena amicta]|nr:hypothetical protein C8F01DRAFT_973949 [Mycena amicta]